MGFLGGNLNHICLKCHFYVSSIRVNQIVCLLNKDREEEVGIGYTQHLISLLISFCSNRHF